MDDIVKRLEKEARNLSVKYTCDMKACMICRIKKLLWKAAHEIEELRSLYNAVKK